MGSDKGLVPFGGIIAECMENAGSSPLREVSCLNEWMVDGEDNVARRVADCAADLMGED